MSKVKFLYMGIYITINIFNEFFNIEDLYYLFLSLSLKDQNQLMSLLKHSSFSLFETIIGSNNKYNLIKWIDKYDLYGKKVNFKCFSPIFYHYIPKIGEKTVELKLSFCKPDFLKITLPVLSCIIFSKLTHLEISGYINIIQLFKSNTFPVLTSLKIENLIRIYRNSDIELRCFLKNIKNIKLTSLSVSNSNINDGILS